MQSPLPRNEPSKNEGIASKRSQWLIVSLVSVACVIVALFYTVRPRFSPAPSVAPPAEVRADPELQHHESSTIATPSKPLPPPLVKDQPGADPSRTLRLDRFWEAGEKIRSAYLSEADPLQLATQFDALAGKDRDDAVQVLRQIATDQTDPSRLQAIQLLLTSTKIGEEPLTQILSASLQQPDTAAAGVAIGVLVSRKDPEASNVLTKAFAAADPPTRLLIVQSISPEDAAISLLQQATSDPDETVRTTALAILSPPAPAEQTAQ